MRAATRKRIPKSKFASPKGSGPNRKKNQYPVHDRKHAANAKGRATQQYKKGKISKGTRDRIHAKANRKLRSGRK